MGIITAMSVIDVIMFGIQLYQIPRLVHQRIASLLTGTRKEFVKKYTLDLCNTFTSTSHFRTLSPYALNIILNSDVSFMSKRY